MQKKPSTKKNKSNKITYKGKSISLYRYDILINAIFKRIKYDEKIIKKVWVELYRLNNLLEDQSSMNGPLVQDIKVKNKLIKDHVKVNKMMIDKYEDKFEEYEKANATLYKQNQELKDRLYGRFKYNIKNILKSQKKKKEELN
jgi:hypothetical protein|tara:strand:- start:106 stop:534 length:429 start_codon:yes stop_codon:yes gene_type:complete